MELYFEVTRKPPRIVNDQGAEVSPDEARMLVNDGKVTNCNLAFQRLSQYDYDIAATLASYK